MPKLILASASPRRLDLLAQINIIPDKIVPADIDETPSKDELPANYVKRMASSKANKISQENPAFYILAADTIVTMGRRILPKAENDEDVKFCLASLSGRSHMVITSVYLVTPNKKIAKKTVASRVSFKRLTKDEINLYIKSGEGLGKAGGYAIQGLAGGFIKKINGSFSSIVGLPLFETMNMLKGAGYYGQDS